MSEIPSEIILQPGPAALTDGLDALHAAIARAARELAGSSARGEEQPPRHP